MRRVHYRKISVRRIFPDFPLPVPACVFLLLCLAGGQMLAAAQQPAAPQAQQISGNVTDSSGSAVVGAALALRCGAFSANASSDSAGKFAFHDVPQESCTLSTQAPGFAPANQTFRVAADRPMHLKIVLALAPESEQIIVSATRTPTRLADAPLADVQLSAAELEAAPALTLDDALRQVPGFSLFRRSGSETTNPTTMGVSLRGLGASGASRAVVLEDGMPLNDPFGGWVYWGRVPRTAVESVEVAEEGSSSLYGSDALGGVVQMLTRLPTSGGLDMEISYGNEITPDISLWAGGSIGSWDASFSGQVFHTTGYILVPPAARGIVNTPAGSEDAALDATIGRRFAREGRIFGRGWYYNESRRNGTPIQTNRTAIGGGALGVDAPMGSYGSLTLRIFGDGQDLHQNFSSVAASQMSETITDSQIVPAQQLVGYAQWARAAGWHQNLVVEFDANEIVGRSNETLFSSGARSRDVNAGGRQRTFGILGEDLIRVSPNWLVSLSARFDRWDNFDASLLCTSLTSLSSASCAPPAAPGPPVLTLFAGRVENAFSPRLTVIHRFAPNFSVSASLYRAFRAPTLNELYRNFRQGTTETLANSSLRAEQLTGGEASAGWNAPGQRVELRGTFFWADIVNPIANVPMAASVCASNPAPQCQQRENLGRTRSAGFELDAVARITSRWRFTAGYQYANSVIVNAPADPALVGLWVQQVPRNVFTFGVDYTRPSLLTFSADGRWVGLQYDTNQLPLGQFFVLDAEVAHSFGHGVELFATAQNLTNAAYAIAAATASAPQNDGAPITGRIGLRIQLGRR
jgi:outer membrane receptor protein involved in Fe transport